MKFVITDFNDQCHDRCHIRYYETNSSLRTLTTDVEFVITDRVNECVVIIKFVITDRVDNGVVISKFVITDRIDDCVVASSSCVQTDAMNLSVF